MFALQALQNTRNYEEMEVQWAVAFILACSSSCTSGWKYSEVKVFKFHMLLNMFSIFPSSLSRFSRSR
jgi:hypothetical protein